MTLHFIIKEDGKLHVDNNGTWIEVENQVQLRGHIFKSGVKRIERDTTYSLEGCKMEVKECKGGCKNFETSGGILACHDLGCQHKKALISFEESKEESLPLMENKSDNELIAEFMGVSEQYGRMHISGRGSYVKKNYPHQLKYHNNWSWLMPVVEKIETTEDGFISRVTGCRIEGYLCDFVDHENTERACQFSQTSKIDAVYKAVVEFIKWYNQHGKQ